jgi:putative ABC transport system permease protein
VFHREDLRLSIRSLLGRPAESLLLVVGVTVVVAATVVGVTLTATASATLEQVLSSRYFREIVVTGTARSWDAPAWKTLPSNVELSIEDLERARSTTQAVQYAYLNDWTGFHLKAAGGVAPQHEHVDGSRVTPEFFAAGELAAAHGSLFTAEDMARGEPVMVVGAKLGATLFEDGVALGRTVVADLRSYRIIGVLERSYTGADERAFVPAGSLRENYDSSGESIVSYGWNVPSLHFTVADPARLDDALAQLIAYFDAVYGEDLLDIADPRAIAQEISDAYGQMVKVILFMAVSALLIAALNLSAIFANRALRRRRSAGILKAMGAARTRVCAVFLLDALAVGAIGSAIGIGGLAVLARLLERTGPSRELGFSGFDPAPVVVGVVASWIIVAACSALPAVAAARAPAADAIRYE